MGLTNLQKWTFASRAVGVFRPYRDVHGLTPVDTRICHLRQAKFKRPTRENRYLDTAPCLFRWLIRNREEIAGAAV